VRSLSGVRGLNSDIAKVKRLDPSRTSGLRAEFRHWLCLTCVNADRSSNRHGDVMDTESQLLPLCPNCGKPMRFTRLIPAIGTVPELYSYCCDPCGESITEVGEPGERRDLLRHFEIGCAASQPN